MIKDLEQTEFKVIENLFDFSGKEVLEIGCGNGRFTEFLAKRCKRLVAIDPDEKEIAEAKEKFPDVDFRVASGENLEFEDSSFDAVVFSWSLHHHNEPAKALEEAARVLKKGGIMLINEPTLESDITKLFHVSDNEEELLKKAASAIEKIDLPIEKDEVITTKWIFDGIDDIYGYLKARNLDQNQRDKIVALLGDQKDSDKILLKDVLRVVILRK